MKKKKYSYERHGALYVFISPAMVVACCQFVCFAIKHLICYLILNVMSCQLGPNVAKVNFKYCADAYYTADLCPLHEGILTTDDTTCISERAELCTLRTRT